MKKMIYLSVVIMLILSFPLVAHAKEAPLDSVYVSVSVRGKLVVPFEKVTLSDADGDGALTVNDVLILTHRAFCPQGEAAYSSEETEYGLSLTKLWNDESGSYGYYKNDESCLSLADTVKNGDFIYAYSYADLEGWSDIYTYFDCKEVTLENDERRLSVTLNACGFDDNWMPYVYGFSGAEILVDGKPTGIFTDENGKAEVTLSPGHHTVSARSEGYTVPSVCSVSVEGEGGIGVNVMIIVAAAFAAVCVAAVFVLKARRKR